jgi:hypothetical protein
MNFTQKKVIVSVILNDGPLEVLLDKEKKEFVQNFLLDHHLNVKSLKISKLCIRKNATMPHNNFYFSGELNGLKVVDRPIGITKVKSDKNILSAADMMKRLTEGMREAVRNDTWSFKQEQLKWQDQCSLCGEDLDLSHPENIHADHFGNDEFRHIMTKFLAEKPNLIVEDRGEDNVGLTKLVDNEHKRLWIEYHRLSARLQLVCVKCNLSKGKK